MRLVRLFQPHLDPLHFEPRRRDPLLRLLLKRMKDTDDAFEPDGINAAKCVSVEIRNDFQNTRALKAFEWLGIRVFPALLSGPKRKPDPLLHRDRKRRTIISRRSYEFQGRIVAGHLEVW